VAGLAVQLVRLSATAQCVVPGGTGDRRGTDRRRHDEQHEACDGGGERRASLGVHFQDLTSRADPAGRRIPIDPATSRHHFVRIVAQLGAVVFPARSPARTQCWYAPDAFAGTFHATETVRSRRAEENHTCLSRATTLPCSLTSSRRPTWPESSETRERS